MNEVDRKSKNVLYVNRFRKSSFEDGLETIFEETKTSMTLSALIETQEAKLRNLRTEEYIAKQAFNTVKNEERVRIAKSFVGIRDENEALLQEVYDRAQQSAKLRGEGKSWRNNTLSAYNNLSAWVRSGRYGRYNFATGENTRDFDPLFVEYQLMSAASNIMYQDTTKKGTPLADRVFARRNELWKEWGEAGQPVDRRKEVV